MKKILFFITLLLMILFKAQTNENPEDTFENQAKEQKATLMKKYGKKLGEKIYFIELSPGMTWEMMDDAMNKSYIKREGHTQSKNHRGKWDVYTYKSASSTYYIITLLNGKIIDFQETDL
ncbi:hypothetical protein [Elizabethkingia anophelis]|uniref:hypothetical protein n=1 Tax=Elizabethkingia anophelis TaxID=1117645 RepID=UPI000442CACC|nr:hypothetical protein [Elizabethkingia anophelis]CDN79546.1 exported hypothetical protein [Elizabethkingia anophelis]